MLVTNQVSLVDAVLKGLTVLLVLHPIVAGLSFVTLFIAVTIEDHTGSILCLITAMITGLVCDSVSYYRSRLPLPSGYVGWRHIFSSGPRYGHRRKG
jgi:hypothetical protein